jgi:ribonuclease HI
MSDDAAVWMLFTDGGSRGNPGLAAYAFVLVDPSGGIYQEAECLGRMTNNQAEYYALLNGLDAALDLGVANLHVRSDSELMVKQMQGLYQVKNPDLREIFQKTKALQGRFAGKVRFEHVRREANKRSDELCNMAMDGNPSPKRRGQALRESFVSVDPGALAKAGANSFPTTLENVKTQKPAPDFSAGLLAALDEALKKAATGQQITAREVASQIQPWLRTRA